MLLYHIEQDGSEYVRDIYQQELLNPILIQATAVRDWNFSERSQELIKKRITTGSHACWRCFWMAATIHT